jgi:branched-chain amino acid transport system substrate-binding protein
MLRSFLGSFLLGVAAFAAAAVATSGAQAQTIRIAILGPMAFVQGENHWAGAEMARDEINKAGGVNVGGKRMQVELIRGDTNEMTSVPDATNAIERVITRDKADFLIGGFRSEAVIAMQEVAMDYKKIFLGAGAADPTLGVNVEKNYERYKYWFRYTPTKGPDLFRTLLEVTNTVGNQIRQSAKREQLKVALVAEKALWTEPILKGLQAALPKYKIDVVGTWQPSPVATDVNAELAAIERADVDIVFTLLSGPVGITLARQMGERNMRAVGFGINVEGQKDDFWKAAAGKANYAATLDTYADVEITPKTLQFVRAFRERYKKAPTYNAATYDAIMMLKTVIEQEGTTNADKLVAAIEKIEYVGSGSIVTFDKRHDLVWAVGKTAGIAVQWQDGKKVAFWPPDLKGAQPFKMPAR